MKQKQHSTEQLPTSPYVLLYTAASRGDWASGAVYVTGVYVFRLCITLTKISCYIAMKKRCQGYRTI